MRFLTAGESHGRCLLAILEGMVSGLPINEDAINCDLARRQTGYGRGGRMSIERDVVEILSGLEDGRTLGSPITIRIPNQDFKIDTLPQVTRPRPGHADLVGAMKYDRSDIRDVLERASARETTARVALGSICKQFLDHFGVKIVSHVISIGGVGIPKRQWSFREIQDKVKTSAVRCCDPVASRKMMARIDFAKKNKDTLGGIFEVRVHGVPRLIAEDKKFQAGLVFGLMSIQAVKGIETKRTNSATNSVDSDIILVGAMKPIATLMRPLKSVDIKSKTRVLATVERSDVTAVPACGVVAEAMAAFEIAKFYMDRFGGVSLRKLKEYFHKTIIDLDL